MEKKGVVSGVIVFWAVGILVVFLIIYIVAGPQKLLSGARDIAFSFGLGQLPGEEEPEFEESPIPADLVGYFNALVAEINEKKRLGQNRCLMALDKIPDSGDYKVKMSPGRAEIIKLGFGGFAPTEHSAEILGFKPCVVAWEGAEKFYRNWLDGSPSLETPEFYNLENAMTLQLKPGNELITPKEGYPPGREYKILEEGGKLYLYNADNKHFCFITSHGGSQCNANGGSIEEGCINRIPYFETGLIMCEDKSGLTSLDGKTSAETEAQKISQAIQNGLDNGAGKCLIPYGQLDMPVFDDENNWKIGLQKAGSKIQFVQVNKEGRVGKLDIPAISANLCLVEKGPPNGAAWNLYRNTEEGESRTPEYLSRGRFAIQNRDGKYQITIGEQFDDNPNAYFNIKSSDRRYLYKADSGHVCFLTLREDHGVFDDCDDAQDSGIDDECYKEWVDEKKILTCDEKVYGEPVLHLKIDPWNNPTEIWAFHLTDDTDHGYGSSDFSNGHCNVYATNEERGSADQSAIWHINPGGRVSRSVTDSIFKVFDGLDGYIGHVTSHNKASPFTGGGERIGNTEYTLSTTSNSRCSNEGAGECTYAARHPDSGNNYHFWPKFGLLCGDNKLWKPCNEANLNSEISAGGNDYRCVEESFSVSGTSVRYFTWITT